MSNAGVYAIQNLESGRTYIGSTANLRRRWIEHRFLLNKGAHHARDLQIEWQLYGESAFVFVVLEHIDDEETRIFCEQMHIDRLNQPYNANGRAGSGPRSGFSPSPETRLKISAANKGRRRTPEQRARISRARSGKKLSPAHRAAISAGGRGRKQSAEMKQKVREANLRRPPCTYGHKISAAKLGRPWTANRRRAYELSLITSEV